MAFLLVATDNFNRANSSSLGSTPFGAYAWIEESGDSTIDTNQMRSTGSNGDATINLGQTDYAVEALLVANNSYISARFAGPATGTWTSLYAGRENTDIKLYAIAANNVQDVGTYAYGGGNAALKMEVIGDAVTVYVNGAARLTYTIVDAVLRTGTKVGLRSNTNQIYADDFQAWTWTGGSTWRIDVHDLNSGTARITNLPVMDFTFGWVLNAPGSFEANCALTNASITRTNLEPGQREIRVYRNGTLVWGGYLWGARVELRDRVTIRAEGYSSRLRRRYVMNDLTYVDVAQETILRNLIDHTQGLTSGSLGITTTLASNHTGGSILRDRDYCAMQHPNIGAEVDQFTELDDGLDYFIGPTATLATNKLLKTFQPRRGTDRTATVTIDQTKAAGLAYELSADGVVSRLVTTGQDDCNPPEDDRTDATALTNFGLLQQFDSVDYATLRDVAAHGAETIRNLKQAQRLSMIVLPEANLAWAALDVGDLFTLASNRGPASGFGNFSEAARCLSFEVMAQPGAAGAIVFYRLLGDSVTA